MLWYRVMYMVAYCMLIVPDTCFGLLLGEAIFRGYLW